MSHVVWLKIIWNRKLIIQKCIEELLKRIIWMCYTCTKYVSSSQTKTLARAGLFFFCVFVPVCMGCVTPPTETFTFHPNGSQGSIMHQATDGWLSLLSFVAFPHHFPIPCIRKQRWKREMKTGWQKRDTKKRVGVNEHTTPRLFLERLKKNWSFTFLGQSKICTHWSLC